MIDHPLPPWTLVCPWCEHSLVVFGRGGRGNDQGSGYEAAQQMERHIAAEHGRTWSDFLAYRRHVSKEHPE